MDGKLGSILTIRVAKIAAVVGAGYFLLPYFRDMVLFRLQPFLMHGFHQAVEEIKAPLFQLLAEHSRSNDGAAKSVRILEIGAADGLNLPCFPPGARVVAVEPFSKFRRKFERRLSEVNASRRSSQPEVRLEAWHSITAEELQQFTKPPYSDQPVSSSGDSPIGHFDVVLSTFTLCTVRDPQLVLRVCTHLVKPGGLLLFLEHVRPDTRILRVLSFMIQPLWSWIFAGCRLFREPHLLIQSEPELTQAWEVLYCKLSKVPGASRLDPVRCVVALAARRKFS